MIRCGNGGRGEGEDDIFGGSMAVYNLWLRLAAACVAIYHSLPCCPHARPRALNKLLITSRHIKTVSARQRNTLHISVADWQMLPLYNSLSAITRCQQPVCRIHLVYVADAFVLEYNGMKCYMYLYISQTGCVGE